MSERWLLLAVPLVLAGCFGKDGGDSDDDDDGGGGWDSGSTDGGGSDGGGSDGGGGGGGGACPELMPLHLDGQVATYEYLDSVSVSGTYSVAWLGEESFEGEAAWRLRTASAYSGEGFEAEYTADTWYRCDSEGAWTLYQELAGTTWTSAGPTEYASQTTWIEPGLVMPRGAAVGTAWTQRYTGITSDGHSDTEFSYSIDYEVLYEETVEVPAGVFDALYIEQTNEDDITGWYAAPGVGSVASAAAWLVDLD